MDRTRANRAFWQVDGLQLSDPRLSRPRNDSQLRTKKKKQFVEDQRRRNAMEGTIGQGRRRCGFPLIREAGHQQGSSILARVERGPVHGWGVAPDRPTRCSPGARSPGPAWPGIPSLPGAGSMVSASARHWPGQASSSVAGSSRRAAPDPLSWPAPPPDRGTGTRSRSAAQGGGAYQRSLRTSAKSGLNAEPRAATAIPGPLNAWTGAHNIGS